MEDIDSLFTRQSIAAPQLLDFDCDTSIRKSTKRTTTSSTGFDGKDVTRDVTGRSEKQFPFPPQKKINSTRRKAKRKAKKAARGRIDVSKAMGRSVATLSIVKGRRLTAHGPLGDNEVIDAGSVSTPIDGVVFIVIIIF